jgi:general stress protein 26
MSSSGEGINVNGTKPIGEVLKALFEDQSFAVLATDDQGQPYVSLMAFTATVDLKSLIFATERETRKHANLARNPRTAALIDNRPGTASELGEAIAVTALGEMRESNKNEHKRAFLQRHPYLETFVESPSCTLVEMRVKTYLVARGVQGVEEYQP